MTFKFYPIAIEIVYAYKTENLYRNFLKVKKV